MNLPSEKILEQKKQLVIELSEKLQNACAGVVVDYKGINVADDTKMRKELREAGIEYFVVKNTMLRFAAENAHLEEMKDVLEGTTSIALSQDDQVAAARVIVNYVGEDKPVKIKCGFVDGKIFNEQEVMALAKLPSKEVLVAKALGGLNAPISGFVGVLNANLRGLVCALNAIAEKQGA